MTLSLPGGSRHKGRADALSEGNIEISIVDDTSRRDCDAACGVDWSAPEAIDLAGRQVRKRFGDGTRLEYYDLARAAPDRQTQEWRRTIRENSLSVPLLLINGRLRVAGQFDIRQMIDAVEAEMEIGA